MDLTFINPGFAYSVASIMQFQNDDTGDNWRGALFTMYPQLDREAFDLLDSKQRNSYLQEKLYAVYTEEEQSLFKKVQQYNAHWASHQKEVEDALSEAFGVNCHNHFHSISGNITLNPICPRFLDTCSFDVFYQYSEKGALGVAIHEMIHFIWFDLWQKHFHDNPEAYEAPHLKWLFSEAAVDAITRNDNRLSEKYPYTTYAYPCFYSMAIDGIPILDTLTDIYQNTDMLGFMEKGYAFFTKHESEIQRLTESLHV